MYKGCDNCIHESKGEREEPCNDCTRNCGNSDNWKSIPDPLVEKRLAFDDLCSERECADCPILKSGWDICDNKNTEDFSEEELDKAIEMLSVPENDVVNRPAHYTDGNIEVIDFIDDKKLGFCLGNVVKYVARAGKKNPDKEIEDLEKAEWYLKHYIEKLKEAK